MKVFRFLAVCFFSISLSACGGGNSQSSVSGSVSETGQSKQAQLRIVNGQLVSQADIPMLRRMLITDELGQPISVCSGTFISPSHYLTAAHCVVDEISGAFPPERLLLEVRPGEFAQATGLAIHPSYQHGLFAPSSEYAGVGYFPGDIAVVVMNDVYTDALAPVSLQVPVAGMSILIGGYGVYDESQPIDLQLRYGYTTIDAVSMNDAVFYWVFDSLLESNTCYGDSGGPAFAQFSEDSPVVLIGLTSGGGPDCGLNSYSFDTLVSHPANLDFLFLVTGGAFAYY